MKLDKIDKDILTVDDLLEILPFGRNTIYSMLKNKEIPNKLIHNKRIVFKTDLIKWSKNQNNS